MALLVANVGLTQSTRRHSAQMFSGFNQNNGLALKFCGIGGNHATGSATIHTDVGLNNFLCIRIVGKKDQAPNHPVNAMY